jgi:hypothetical protein
MGRSSYPVEHALATELEFYGGHSATVSPSTSACQGVTGLPFCFQLLGRKHKLLLPQLDVEI